MHWWLEGIRAGRYSLHGKANCGIIIRVAFMTGIKPRRTRRIYSLSAVRISSAGTTIVIHLRGPGTVDGPNVDRHTGRVVCAVASCPQPKLSPTTRFVSVTPRDNARIFHTK